MEQELKDHKLKKICLVIPYFGKWPNYFQFFLKSCEFNPTISWLFYTDCEVPSGYPKNVKFISASLDDFNRLASQKIELKINVTYPYKICDFKPAYGHIFEDYLKDFDFWGHGDIDLVYGDIRKFLTEEILSGYDIITTHKLCIAGTFTIYRNDNTKYLYRGNSDYKKVFLIDKMVNFDETNFVFDENVFLSKNFCGKTGVISMTHYVAKLARSGKIRIYAEPLIFNIKAAEKIEIEFNNGKLIADNREIFLVHFLFIRINKNLPLPKLNKIRNIFFINSFGIYYDKKIPYFKKIRISIEILFVNYFRMKAGNMLIRFFPRLYYFYKEQKYKKYQKYKRPYTEIK